MYNHILYVSYWVVNALVLFSAGIFSGQYVILGNNRFGSIESSIYASFWITFIIWVCWDFAMSRDFKLDKKIVTLTFFFIINLFAFWAVSKFYNTVGFHLTNYIVVFVIAVIATLLQRFAWTLVVNKSLSLRGSRI